MVTWCEIGKALVGPNRDLLILRDCKTSIFVKCEGWRLVSSSTQYPACAVQNNGHMNGKQTGWREVDNWQLKSFKQNNSAIFIPFQYNINTYPNEKEIQLSSSSFICISSQNELIFWHSIYTYWCPSTCTACRLQTCSSINIIPTSHIPVSTGAVKRSIGSTTGFHIHWEGPY